jgi:hypothetical protein
MKSPCCLCEYVNPHSLTSVSEQVLMKLDTHGMALEPVLNPSHQSVCLNVNPVAVARQRLIINVATTTNTQYTGRGLSLIKSHVTLSSLLILFIDD